MKFLKKNWSNILFIIIIILVIIPQTRKPIQVSLNRLFAFSPSEVAKEDREEIGSYDWKLRDLDGNRVNFEESRGSVAIVNLWATWCPPCIAEMPSFEELYNDYGNKIDFYFVSSEESDRLMNFMQKKEYSFPVYQPLSAGPPKMQSNSLPTTFVISKTGEILVRKTGAADWNSSRLREKLDVWIGEE
jgi:thiol-disulfide isomerase/thioredoxin